MHVFFAVHYLQFFYSFDLLVVLSTDTALKTIFLFKSVPCVFSSFIRYCWMSYILPILYYMHQGTTQLTWFLALCCFLICSNLIFCVVGQCSANFFTHGTHYKPQNFDDTAQPYIYSNIENAEAHHGLLIFQ